MLYFKSFLFSTFLNKVVFNDLVFNIIFPVNHIFNDRYLHKVLFCIRKDGQFYIPKRYFNVTKTMFSRLPVVTGGNFKELVDINLCPLQNLWKVHHYQVLVIWAVYRLEDIIQQLFKPGVCTFHLQSTQECSFKVKILLDQIMPIDILGDVAHDMVSHQVVIA